MRNAPSKELTECRADEKSRVGLALLSGAPSVNTSESLGHDVRYADIRHCYASNPRQSQEPDRRVLEHIQWAEELEKRYWRRGNPTKFKLHEQ